MLRLLIAEDEKGELDYLTSYIRKKHGGEIEIVAECSNGGEAETEGLRLRPDAAFLDINMPQKSGLEVARSLKNANPDIRIVILTAFSLFQYAKEAISIGVVEYLVKPYRDSELDAVIASITALKQNDEAAVGEKLSLGLDNLSKDKDRVHPVIKRSLSYLEEHYAERISLESMCEAIGFSSSYVSKCLNSKLGKSFSTLLLEIRCEKAAEKLASGLFVKETSYEVGFSDEKYFSKCFKAVYGISPRQYHDKLEE